MTDQSKSHMLDMKLAGKAVLVTGATSGLGRQFALALAHVGAIPILSGRRVERLEALQQEIHNTGEAAHILELDVCDTHSIEAKLNQAWEFEGQLWGLVNNSGVAAGDAILDVKEADYDFVMDTNTKGTFFMAQAFGRLLNEQSSPGHIVNIASLAAFKTLPNNSVYCMSKAATAHMTRMLAHEWAPLGINVNAICPGYIKTEINAAFFESEKGRNYIKRFPRRRIGQDTDLNALLIYLLSPLSAFVTGSLIVADDGQMLA